MSAPSGIGNAGSCISPFSKLKLQSSAILAVLTTLSGIQSKRVSISSGVFT